MKRGILIGMAIIITTLMVMGTISTGRGYMYSSRKEGSTTSMCVTPGDWEVHTVTFSIGIKNADYEMMIIDLDNEDSAWPHVGTADTHIDIISIATTANTNDTFVGSISLGFLRTVSLTNASFYQIYEERFNAYSAVVDSIYRDYASHPISCRSTEAFGPHATTYIFQSDEWETGPDGGGYLPEVGDLMLEVDVGAGNIAFCGTIQYVISPN